jgi:hypothetical protein
MIRLYGQRPYIEKESMKELYFITGEACELTKEVRPFVELFDSINEDIRVIELDLNNDPEEVAKLFDGKTIAFTPTYVSVIDGKVKRSEQGQICENRLLNMFSDKEFRPTNSTYTATEDIVHQVREAKKLVDAGLAKADGMPVEVKPYVASILANEPIKIDDVKDIFLFLFTVRRLRKHGWELPENLTNARIMWQLHGGDPAFKWSHKIINDAIDNGDVPAAGLGPEYITPEQYLANGEQY